MNVVQNLSRRGLLVLLAGWLLAAAGTSQAAFVTYTQRVTATGTLNGTVFVAAALTFTQTADTDAVVSVPMGSFNFFSVQALTSTVNIAGVGTARFTLPTFTASQSALGVGLGQGTAGTGGPSVLTILTNQGGTYNLRTSVGPLTGPAMTAPPFVSFATDRGLFQITGFNSVGTFQAQVVPEPASAVLVGVGLITLGTLARSRRRRRPAAGACQIDRG